MKELTPTEINKRQLVSLQVLGLKAGATPVELKKVYRRLAMVHHPDKGGDVEKFKRVSACYEHLCKYGTKPQIQQSISPIYYSGVHSTATHSTTGGFTVIFRI